MSSNIVIFFSQLFIIPMFLECKKILTSMVNSCQQYLKKLHMQERAIEEVKLAIKPFYQKRDINKDEYKEILRKAVQKVG